MFCDKFSFLSQINLSLHPLHSLRLWRKEKISSEVHFFSSHFFTALHNGGVTSVKSWTIKKGIDVFKKSLIFVPINESLHWSLCVIANPVAVIDVVENVIVFCFYLWYVIVPYFCV